MLVRCVFWFSLVAALVPYREFDPAHARFSVDEDALMAQIAALPHYCREHGTVCDKAAALTAVIGREGLAFIKETAIRLQAQSRAATVTSAAAATSLRVHG
jgi:hypothetical protein